MLQQKTGELTVRTELISSVPLLASNEPRAPIAILSPAKRAALIACLMSGTLHKRCGVWTPPSDRTGEKPISGATVADLGRDGMLALTVLGRTASARLTPRGSWFARTAAAELARPLGEVAPDRIEVDRGRDGGCRMACPQSVR